ncbi:hypothetical protein MJO28_000886 [Puccinia striiformis f. sp. tritici]|uniref:F-box domain-containing protein n=4 Tax=Puccinia striiformis TaxID=27350 RepID=A0A0L0VR77_9BASI|nr:hypothetical protein Pst134EA_000360 [Puccinia striiformis f. sp. tritici]KNF01781.1 hypothetical protein PSTG_04901 [Puccinia striiformis f. sp. tritici PST-78]POW14089.1 hypothetical protein PSHT_07521 [Puccinia striiformis]KAH9466528.1 hypothetical protein Pst134EB_001581 [Puccinia striiformis f. sp. tritici]KAH9473286.1 hypothetical protein Pst134EA_000360 [Puccinia striiformis f. sp. tritici]KAI7962792.1 hypothetical protein MJO28_000886 [Puccinia striiformis f. sp. tritici]
MSSSISTPPAHQPSSDIKDCELKAWLALNPSRPFPIARLPETLILQIFSSLDLPDLASIAATGNKLLINLSTDAVLHRARLRSVGPHCITPHLKRRPNILEIAKSGKFKGLNLESKIMRGCYLSSPNSVRLLENSNRVERLMIRQKLNRLLSRRPSSRSSLLPLNLIDKELLFCSNKLAPVLRRLKRQQAKDLLARKLRYSNDDIDHFNLIHTVHFGTLIINDSNNTTTTGISI